MFLKGILSFESQAWVCYLSIPVQTWTDENIRVSPRTVRSDCVQPSACCVAFLCTCGLAHACLFFYCIAMGQMPWGQREANAVTLPCRKHTSPSECIEMQSPCIVQLSARMIFPVLHDFSEFSTALRLANWCGDGAKPMLWRVPDRTKASLKVPSDSVGVVCNSGQLRRCLSDPSVS